MALVFMAEAATGILVVKWISLKLQGLLYYIACAPSI